ncbi:small membrane protein [Klebsiella pneumoniae]
MENLFFLVVAAILLAVSVYFLISYLKDRKKTKLTFNNASSKARSILQLD